jgi:hypothetical protein
MKPKVLGLGLLLLIALSVSRAAFADALTVTTSGPSSVMVRGYNAVGVTWSASASSGVAPYTYNWYRNSTFLASGQNFHATICGGNEDGSEILALTVVATDSIGQTGTATHNTTVNYSFVEGGGRGPRCPF